MNNQKLYSYLKNYGTKAVNAVLPGSLTGSAQEQYQSIAKALQAYFTQDLLKESGRTISNVDRQLVADIFGNITEKNIGTSPETIKKKLMNAKEQLGARNQEYYTILDSVGLYNPKRYKTTNKNYRDQIADLTTKETEELNAFRQSNVGK